MDKTTKIVIGCVFIGAAIGVYIYNKNNNSTTNTATANPCPVGQVQCPNGKCYDPTLHYLVNPCGASVAATIPNKQVIINSDINSSNI